MFGDLTFCCLRALAKDLQPIYNEQRMYLKHLHSLVQITTEGTAAHARVLIVFTIHVGRMASTARIKLHRAIQAQVGLGWSGLGWSGLVWCIALEMMVSCTEGLISEHDQQLSAARLFAIINTRG